MGINRVRSSEVGIFACILFNFINPLQQSREMIIDMAFVHASVTLSCLLLWKIYFGQININLSKTVCKPNDMAMQTQGHS